MSERDEERIEADLLAEDFQGKPIDHGSTAKAIAALEKRLTHLRERLRRCLTDESYLHAAVLNDEQPPCDVVAGLRADIRSAETQLAAYREQLKGRN